MLKRIKTDTSNTQVIAPIQSEETFNGIFIRVTGTGVAATQIVGADFGRVRYWKRNEIKVDAPLDWFRVMTPYVFGNGDNVATLPAAATAVEYTAFIPRSYVNEHNVDHVTPGDNARIEINFGANFAAGVHIASGPTTEVMLMPCKGINLYDMTILEQQYSLAASQTFVVPIQHDNISFIALGESVAGASANWSAISLALATGIRGGNLILDIGGDQYNMLAEAAISLTNQLYGFKVGGQSNVDATAAAASTDNILWTAVYDSQLTGVASGNGMADTAALTILNSTSAVTASVLVCGRRYSSTNLALSTEKVNRYKQASEYSKTVSGRTTAVKDLKAIRAL